MNVLTWTENFSFINGIFGLDPLSQLYELWLEIMSLWIIETFIYKWSALSRDQVLLHPRFPNQ